MQALPESPQVRPAPDADVVASDSSDRPARLRRRAPETWVGLAVAALTAFTSFWRLTVPSWHVDEILFAISGRYMVDGDFSHLRQHPPLGQLLYGLGQLLPGGPLLDVRLVATTLGCATGALLFVLGRRIAGVRCGLVAAALWAVLPHLTHPLGADILVPRLDRYALLDVVAGALMAGALVAGWWWVTDGGSRWRNLTGVLVGLAAAAKLTGVLVFPGIVVFVVWGRGRRGALEAAKATGLAVAAFAVCYLPFGFSAPDALRHMVDYQLAHLERGHSVTVGGEIRRHTPWWAQLDFMWQGDGALVVLPLLAAVVAALVLVRRRAVLYVALAVVVPFAVLSRSGVSLPHYRYVWLAPLFLLAALGIDHLLRTRGWRVAVVALAIPLLIAGAGTTWRIATLERADYGRAADLVREAGLDRGRLLVNGHNPVLRGELPDMARIRQVTPETGPPDVVMVDRLYEERHPRPEVRDAARTAGLRYLRVDRLDVWIRA